MSLSDLWELLAMVLSYLFELCALPFHAARLTALRLASRRARYRLRLHLEEELAALREAIRVAQRMEGELLADLQFRPSQELAVAAFFAGTRRLKRKVAEDLSEGLAGETEAAPQRPAR